MVLSILAGGENYGYEIIKQVKLLSGGQLEWSDGMLYPVLHRLERDGLIAGRWELTDEGRRRKYYRLTARGKQTSCGQSDVMGRESWRRSMHGAGARVVRTQRHGGGSHVREGGGAAVGWEIAVQGMDQTWPADGRVRVPVNSGIELAPPGRHTAREWIRGVLAGLR